MPDKDNKLTEEEKKAVVDWINKRAPGMTCGVCGQKHFILGDHAIAGFVHSGGGLALGGVTYPQIMVICTNCGHTINFNAVVIGALKPPASEAPKEEAKESEVTANAKVAEKAGG